MISETLDAGSVRFRVEPEVTASIHDTGIVIFDGRRGRLFRCNVVGALIWQGIEAESSLETIAAKIGHQYQLAVDSAREHTIRFLADLERQSLIVRENRA
jgi:hypothetical protein